jgi:hypothetical protein
MTKHLHQLATRLQRSLLAAGWPTPPHLAVMRDAWASLYRWHESGEHVYRLRTDVRAAPLLADLPLATAPVVRPGVCYVLDRDQWLIIARHDARQPVIVRAPDYIRAYSEPMLTYATELADGVLAGGTINLRDTPTLHTLRIPSGTVIGELGTRRLEAEELGDEMLRLARCLPYYYAPQD